MASSFRVPFKLSASVLDRTSSKQPKCSATAAAQRAAVAVASTIRPPPAFLLSMKSKTSGRYESAWGAISICCDNSCFNAARPLDKPRRHAGQSWGTRRAVHAAMRSRSPSTNVPSRSTNSTRFSDSCVAMSAGFGSIVGVVFGMRIKGNRWDSVAGREISHQQSCRLYGTPRNRGCAAG